jgi:hypothetical protein
MSEIDGNAGLRRAVGVVWPRVAMEQRRPGSVPPSRVYLS